MMISQYLHPLTKYHTAMGQKVLSLFPFIHFKEFYLN